MQIDLDLLDDVDDDKKEYPLLEEGDYEFQVMNAENAIATSSGNSMITLMLNVFDKEGKKFLVWDRLVNTPKALYRIKNFCKATGVLENLKNSGGALDADDCVDLFGNCHVSVEPATEQYKAKNVVDYYIEQSPEMAAHKAAQDASLNDEIPF